MREWYSASDLAALGLPGLPKRAQHIRRAANNAGWQSRAIATSGGSGREYHISALPEAARLEIARRGVHIGKQGAEGAEAGGDTRADARLAILAAHDDYRKQSGLGICAARESFARLYDSRKLTVDDWIQEAVPSLSPRSIAQWQKQAAEDGAARLAGRYGHRRGSGIIDRDEVLRTYCIAQVTARPHLTAAQLTRAIETELGQQIPRRTVQRWMQNWRETDGNGLQAVASPDGWRSRRKPGFGSRSAHVTEINALWEIDTTPADVMLIDGRYSIVGIVDVWSRRAMVRVTKTPKAAANLSLLRRAILDWGVPETLKTDRGSDYMARQMLRALCDLKIAHDPCTPFKPEEKPHIERFFGTMTRQLFELLPGYIGHNVADRQAIESRRSFAERLGQPVDGAIAVSLSAAELQQKIDEWIEGTYHHQTHAGLKGSTPFERVASSRDAIRRIECPRALDVLMLAAPDQNGVRVVGKKGIHVRNHVYIAAELGAYVGQRVRVRIDSEDASRIVCYDLDGKFLCVAEDPQLTGADQRKIAMAAINVANAHVAAFKRQAREYQKRWDTAGLADRMLQRRLAEQRKLIGLPAPEETHETPAIAQAAAAAKALDSKTDNAPAPLSEADRALAAEAKTELFGPADETVVRMQPEHLDDVAFAKWALANPDNATADQMAYCDEILTSRGMEMIFPASAIEAARARMRALKHAARSRA